MYPHRIRLRGPWQWEAAGASGSMTVPGEVPHNGPVRVHRRFGWMARLDAHERAWLIISDFGADAVVKINGEAIGPAARSFEVEVTHLLRARNMLEIHFDAAAAGSRIDEVFLEVRATAWLRDVEVRPREGGYEVTGEVAGTCDQPLDLYVLAGRATLAHTAVHAGNRFRMLTERQTNKDQALRVELVQGAVVWYVIEPTPKGGDH